jgi:hypothetical protein
VTAIALTEKLRQAATVVGMEPLRMGMHSLRSGGATVMMGDGVDVLVLKEFGRWRSEAVSRYTRLTRATTRMLSAENGRTWNGVTSRERLIGRRTGVEPSLYCKGERLHA